MPFQDDKFGHKVYVYEPGWTTEVDYNPDHRPANGAMVIEDRGTDVIAAIRVRDLGVLVIRGWGDNLHGLSLFTDEQLLFKDAPL